MANCYRCGAPWAGWGVECNTCRGIRKMDELSNSLPGQTEERSLTPGEVVFYSCFGLFILSRGDWAVAKFIFFMMKMGFYIMFGWWSGASTPSF